MTELVSPAIDISNARALLLSGAKKTAILAGGSEVSIRIDGHNYAVSSEHPISIELLFASEGAGGPHVGGLVTLTLVADRITLDPAPEGLCLHAEHWRDWIMGCPGSPVVATEGNV